MRAAFNFSSTARYEAAESEGNNEDESLVSDNDEWTRSRQIASPEKSSSSRQWSPSLTRYRDGRDGRSSQSSRQRLQSASMRRPTPLFARQSVESAARLPVVSTPGGVQKSFATTLHASGMRSHNRARGTGGVASTGTGFWPSSLGTSVSLPTLREHRSTPPASIAPRDGNAKTSLLAGVTGAVHEQNMRGTRSMKSLEVFPDSPEDMGTKTSLQSMSGSRKSLARSGKSNSESMLQDVTMGFATLTTSLAELQRRHDDFVPGQTAQSSGFGRARGSKSGDSDAGDPEDDRAARFEAYKMVRKVEPELPPLTKEGLLREGLGEAPKKEAAPQEMVEHNTSRAAIDWSRPAAQKERRASRKEIRNGRMQQATKRREASVDAKAEKTMEKILAAERRLTQARDAARREQNRRHKMQSHDRMAPREGDSEHAKLAASGRLQEDVKEKIENPAQTGADGGHSEDDESALTDESEVHEDPDAEKVEVSKETLHPKLLLNSARQVSKQQSNADSQDRQRRISLAIVHLANATSALASAVKPLQDHEFKMVRRRASMLKEAQEAAANPDPEDILDPRVKIEQGIR